jgi:hypothetical protein
MNSQMLSALRKLYALVRFEILDPKSKSRSSLGKRNAPRMRQMRHRTNRPQRRHELDFSKPVINTSNPSRLMANNSLSISNYLPRQPVRAVVSAQSAASTHRTRRDGFDSSGVPCGWPSPRRRRLCVRPVRRAVQPHRPP